MKSLHPTSVPDTGEGVKDFIKRDFVAKIDA
jgi:hypothetical protein